VGYPGHLGRRFFLNQILREKKRKKKETAPRPSHQMYHYLRLAEFIGAETPERPFALARPPHSAGRAARIAVCPGAEYGPAKRWPAERFAEVIRDLNLARTCEWTIVGTFKDRLVGDEILAQAGQPANVENRCGQTTLDQLITILRSSDVLLTNDTGTMHLAALLGVPTVSIFGSTEPSLTGPLGSGHTILRKQVECSPCFLRTCPIDFRCMMAIEPKAVVAALLSRLARG
jgi:lipopolysaccharide heptosyltransferase II